MSITFPILMILDLPVAFPFGINHFQENIAFDIRCRHCNAGQGSNYGYDLENRLNNKS
jgi:hypothetical protein